MADARVLIVEDDGITARYVQGCLRGHGYGATTVVASGREALSEATTLDPDLMVVDIRLREEDMDGVETVRRLRQRSDVPVIYLTGCSDDDTIRRACTTSPQGYIVKPFMRRELIAAVEIALRERAGGRALGRARDDRPRPGASADEEPYRAIVEDQVEMVCRFRPDGAITYANAACCYAFGRTREDLIGSSFWSLVAPPDREAMRRRVESLTPTRPADVQEARALARCPTGAAREAATDENPELRWQQWSVRVLLDATSRVIGYQAVGRDVTERRRREADRDERLIELQEALANRPPGRGLLPICASCKRIRNEQDEWEVLEGYLRDHYAIEFTHGLCPECMGRLYPGYPPTEDEGGPEPAPETP